MNNIETDRLLLRPFKPEDFQDFFEYIVDPKLCQMLGLPEIKDEASAMEEFQSLGRGGDYAMVYKENGKVIGNFSIEPLRPMMKEDRALQDKKGVALSFAVSAAYQRKGLISEALKRMIAWLFQEQNMDFINCGYFSFNEASQSLQEKFGFAYYGTHIVHRFDQEIETIENMLFREDWMKRMEEGV